MKQIDFVDLPPTPADNVTPKTTPRPTSNSAVTPDTTSASNATAPAKPPRKRGRPAKTQGSKQDSARKTTATKPQASAARQGYRRLTADIPVTLHKQLKMRALEDDCTVTDLIIEAAQALLESRS